MTERSIKEPLVVKQRTSEMEVKPTGPALLLIELDTLCFTLSLEELSATTASSSLNILLLT